MTVLAAIDDSAVARSVLDVARRISELFGTRVESVHVQADNSGASAAANADAAHVPLHVRHGDVVAALRAEMRERDASALVIGSRAFAAGAAAAGQIALDLVQSLDWPVVVVPPDATDRPLRRVLVAVEGDGESHALRGLFERLGDRPIPEVIALHVIEPRDLPPFADSPLYEADAFGREFLLRVSSTGPADPSRIRLETRVGAAPAELTEAARDLDVDLVVIAWHCDLSQGHGRLVRAMLNGATVPVALLPLDVRDDGDRRVSV